jgi:3-hydroxy acid dehydrogenase / malonic semialdehyde reductase
MPIALVTGASAGFGAAIASRFLEQGMKVVACARRFEPLDDLRKAYGHRLLPIALDVQDRTAVQAALGTLPDEFADIDVLVNNAGLALGMAGAHEASPDDWDRMIATNCSGLVHVTRQLLPGMVARRRGSIINMGSVAGEFPYPGGNVYGATKAFVHQFTHNLNADLVGTGVRATCIEPGLCGGTEFSTVRFAGDQKRAQATYEGTVPLTAQDIADVVSWVASRPAHVAINIVSLMPTCQSFGPFTILRTS